MIDLPVGPSKRERPLSLEHETPRLPVPLKDDIDNGSAFQTPDLGSVDLADSDVLGWARSPEPAELSLLKPDQSPALMKA